MQVRTCRRDIKVPNLQSMVEVHTEHTMVYEWETHKDALRRLYVDEKRSVEDIISHMQTNHSFAPRYVAAQIVFVCASVNRRCGAVSSPDCLGASSPLP